MTNCRHLERPIPSLGNGLAPAARAAQSAGEESFHVLLSLMQMIDASRSLLSLERSGTIPMPLPSSLALPCFPSSLLENNPLIVKSLVGWLVSHPMMVSLDLLPWDSVRTLHSPSQAAVTKGGTCNAMQHGEVGQHIHMLEKLNLSDILVALDGFNLMLCD